MVQPPSPLLIAALLCTPLLVITAKPAAAQTPEPGNRFDDYGTVVNVTPIVSREPMLEMVEDCRIVQPAAVYPAQRRGPPAPARLLRSLIGSVVGGAIGNQFGNGRGKKALTVAGAMAGAGLANRDQREPHRYERTHPTSAVEQCSMRERTQYSQQISGYRVQYRYHGTLHTKITPEHPGERVPVQVQVTPRLP